MNDAKRLLSPRQAECLRRVRALQSTDQIARDLQISSGTVNGYIRDAVVALGARDRRHAALIFEEAEGTAYGVGLKRPDEPRPLPGQDIAPPIGYVAAPPAIVKDVTTEAPSRLSEATLARIMREVVNGSRPEGWSMMTRSALVLAAVVVIGMAMLVFSASLEIVYSLAVGMRAAIHR